MLRLKRNGRDGSFRSVSQKRNGGDGSFRSVSPKWNGGDGSFRSAWNIVAHVHDEVIIEADPEDSVDEVCRIMEECPPWAEGLILRADGYQCQTYRKD